jgi:hypothetical protein
MKPMKKISLVIWVTCFTLTVSAQQYKYRDLVPLLQTASQREQISMLWDYMIYDSKEPNVDFRLAKLHYDIFRNTDPLVEYNSAMAHAQEASLRLLRAQKVVTEAEVRKQNEYYAPLFKFIDSKGRPFVEFGEVQKKLQIASDSVNTFKAKMPPIYKAFTKSVNLYGNAVKTFAAINNRYKSLEDLLMLYDDQLEKDLEYLKTSYDSSIYYFAQYTSLTSEYPLAGHKQKFQIRSINVYHLDGLTARLNFLTDNIEFWNYSGWVDEVHKVYNRDIIPLKTKLEQNETRLQQRLTSLDQTASPAGQNQKIDKDLIFNLNNYDRNSLVVALLHYKAFKQEWLSRLKLIGKDSTMDMKLELYSKLIQQNRVADSLLVNVKQMVTPLSEQKHAQFLSKHYNGSKGLESFVHDEAQVINAAFEQHQDILKGNLVAYAQPLDNINKFIKLGNYNLPLFVQKKSISEIDQVSPVTLKQTRNPDGSIYLAGLHRLNKKIANVVAFVARVNPDGKTGWVKDYNFTPDSITTVFDNYVGDIAATQEGCGVVITSSVKGTQNIANTFVFINDKGEEKIFKIKEPKMARKLIYQERSNTFTMTFKGTEETQNYQAEEPVSLVSINILGDLNWRRDIQLAGTVQDVVSVRDGYLLVGNYTSMKDISGKEYKTKVNLGQSNPYLIKIDLKGDIVNIQPIQTPKSIFVDFVVKVNDESVNLLGYESSFTVMRDANATRGNVMHMMTSYNLKKICSDY